MLQGLLAAQLLPRHGAMSWSTAGPGRGGRGAKAYISCTSCRYRWNFKTNHWCFQCTAPLIPNPDFSKKPQGQWSFGPPAVLPDASPFNAASQGQPASPFTAGGPGAYEVAFDQAAVDAWVKGKGGKRAKGPGPPPPAKAAAMAAKGAGGKGGKGGKGGGTGAEQAPPADPFALLRATYGDQLVGKEDLVAQLEAALAPAAPPPPAARVPLLEEEVNQKGIAARRAAKNLEAASLKVIEGEAWLEEAKAEEDAAVLEASKTYKEWQEACAKHAPQPAAAASTGDSIPDSAINLSALLDASNGGQKISIVDGAAFDVSGLDLDEGEREAWDKLKLQLSSEVEGVLTKALGPTCQNIANLREQAQQMRTRLQAKRRKGPDGAATPTLPPDEGKASAGSAGPAQEQLAGTKFDPDLEGSAAGPATADPSALRECARAKARQHLLERKTGGDPWLG